MDCLFCKIISKEIQAEIIYEDSQVLVFLDIHPMNPGHTLLVPKKHAPNCLDTDDQDLAALITTAKRLAPAVLRAVGAEAFNIGVNCGKEAGQVIFHTHLHLMPRFSRDGLKHWPGQNMTAEDLKMTAHKIIKELS